MRLPRDLGGKELIRALGKLGYVVSRQAGSHVRLTTEINGEHHVTVPAKRSLKVGTLAAILDDVGRHHGLSRAELLERLFS